MKNNYKYSKKSQGKLETCHPDLQKIYSEAIKLIDLTILEGLRTKEQQEEYVRTGKSTTLNSKHLIQPDGYSHAVDAAPFPIDWKDTARFAYYQGIIRGIAHVLAERGEISHRTRSGMDWDGDGQLSDHTFVDGPHVELIKK